MCRIPWWRQASARPVLLAAAVATLSACALMPVAPVETKEPNCPGYIDIVGAVTVAMAHADKWGVSYVPETVDVSWIPELWIVEYLPPPGTGAPKINMGLSLDGQVRYCQAAMPCFDYQPLYAATCAVPAERRITAEQAAGAGRLYLYRNGIIRSRQQAVRTELADDAHWVVFFTGGPENDRQFAIEVSPQGKVLKFIEGA